LSAVWNTGGAALVSDGATAVGFPLGVVGEVFGSAKAVQGEDGGGDAVDEVAVTGVTRTRAPEKSKRESSRTSRVEMSRSFIGSSRTRRVGGLEHEAGQDDAGFFARRRGGRRMSRYCSGRKRNLFAHDATWRVRSR